MADKEKERDERATRLAARAGELVASGKAEVAGLFPSRAFDSH